MEAVVAEASRTRGPRSHAPGTCELRVHGVLRRRSDASARAADTAPAPQRSSAASASSAARSCAVVIRCTRSWMSMRSSSGPEIRAR